MFIKIGIGIVSYILMIYFIIFITVKMLNFLSESFVGISLSEACYRLVWGESITKKDYKKSLSPIKKEQKEMTKNEAINDLLEDSSHYRKTNYTSSFLTSDFTGIVSEENAPINESYTFYNPTKHNLLQIEDRNGEIYTHQYELIENSKLKQIVYHDEYSAIKSIKYFRKLGYYAEMKNGDSLGEFIVITNWE